MRKILSIDGGGIRGIIPGVILNALEQRMGKSTLELFDFFAGTSTGGIVALGAVSPDPSTGQTRPASHLVDFYVQRGPSIFSHTLWDKVTAETLRGPKYSAAPLEQNLREYFGEVWLSDLSKDIMVASYEIELCRPYFFKSHMAKAGQTHVEGSDFLVREAARATSAAPTYFPPAKITTTTPPGYLALVDGGLHSNNPAMCAYVEALTLFPDEREFMVVSLGTGASAHPLSYDKAKDWGLLHWAQPVLDIALGAGSDVVEYQLNEIFPPDSKKTRHFRFQTTLGGDVNAAMDCVTPTNLKSLVNAGQNVVRQQQALFDQLCEELA